jgi:hypothetical protein
MPNEQPETPRSRRWWKGLLVEGFHACVGPVLLLLLVVGVWQFIVWVRGN